MKNTGSKAKYFQSKESNKTYNNLQAYIPHCSTFRDNGGKVTESQKSFPSKTFFEPGK